MHPNRPEPAGLGMLPDDRVELRRHRRVGRPDVHAAVGAPVGLAVHPARRVPASRRVDGHPPVEPATEFGRHRVERAVLVDEPRVAADRRDRDPEQAGARGRALPGSSSRCASSRRTAAPSRRHAARTAMTCSRPGIGAMYGSSPNGPNARVNRSSSSSEIDCAGEREHVVLEPRGANRCDRGGVERLAQIDPGDARPARLPTRLDEQARECSRAALSAARAAPRTAARGDTGPADGRVHRASAPTRRVPSTPSTMGALTCPMWAMRKPRPSRSPRPTPSVTPQRSRHMSASTCRIDRTGSGSPSPGRPARCPPRRTATRHRAPARPSTAERTASASARWRAQRASIPSSAMIRSASTNPNTCATGGVPQNLR